MTRRDTVIVSVWFNSAWAVPRETEAKICWSPSSGFVSWCSDKKWVRQVNNILLRYTFEPALLIYTASLICQRYLSLPIQLSHKISRVPVIPCPTRKKTEARPEAVPRCGAMSSYKTCLSVTEFPRWCAHLPDFLLDLVSKFWDL